MAEYFPYFLRVTYDNDTLMDLALPTSERLTICWEAHASGRFIGDDKVLVLFEYYEFENNTNIPKKEEFTIKVGEKIKKKYYEHNLFGGKARECECEFDLVPIDDYKLKYAQIHREYGENALDVYMGKEPRYSKPKEQFLGSMDPLIQEEVINEETTK